MTHPGICPRGEGQKAEPQGLGHVAKHPLKLKRKCVLGGHQGESEIMVTLSGTSVFLGEIKPVSREACTQAV